MKAIRTLFAALLLITACLPTPAAATSVTTDQSDLWWNANESGWGIQMVQRDQAIFATIYVYYSDGFPYWYTALMNYQGNFVWSGDLYESSGTFFETVPYNPAAFMTHKVGTMTWSAPFVNSGTLTYSVNGVQVTKSLTRFVLATDDFSGKYGGGIHIVSTGCFNPTSNGTGETFATIGVTQSGSAFQMSLLSQSTGLTCSIAGTLSQAGQFGSVNGTYSCTDGSVGTFNLFEMAVGVNGISARYSSTFPAGGCTQAGWLGGIRSTQ